MRAFLLGTLTCLHECPSVTTVRDAADEAFIEHHRESLPVRRRGS